MAPSSIAPSLSSSSILPPSPPPISTSWTLSLNPPTLSPSPSHLSLFHHYSFTRPSSDPSLLFTFHSTHASDPVSIHLSRIQFQGPPFSSSLPDPPAPVILGPNDDPCSFALIKRYLYLLPLDLALPPERLVMLAKVAHRWKLQELFSLVCEYMWRGDVLAAGGGVVVEACALTALGGVSRDFVAYYWKVVGLKLEGFRRGGSGGSGGDEVTESEEGGSVEAASVGRSTEGGSVRGSMRMSGKLSEGAKMCPMFPGLWDEAAEQDMLVTVVKFASRSGGVRMREDLMKVVLLDLEPVQEAWVIMRMLQVLKVGELELCWRILREGALEDRVSARGMRLLANQVMRGGGLRRLAREIGRKVGRK